MCHDQLCRSDKSRRCEGCARSFAEGQLKRRAYNDIYIYLITATSECDSRAPGPLLRMVEPLFDYQFRLILIGDSTVGKSSLLKYFTDGKFAELSDPTVGVDFFARLIEVKDGTRIKLQLWDTAGQERFRSITKSYYRNSVGALLIYDVCNRASFEHIPQWMMEARRHIEPHRPVFALVGCKLDLVTNGGRREVSKEEARAFADEHGVHHIETSAKTGINVEEAFRAVTQEVYNRIQTGEYKVEDGWDGIKTGFARPGGLDFNLVEAEPAKTSCC